MESLLYLFILLAFYLLPTVIAEFRKHRNTNSIFVLNLFLGWTLLGWVIALVWAFSAQDEANSTAERS